MRSWIFTAIITIGASRATLAQADEPLETLLNETVVSGPSQTSERAGDAPATVSLLTADDIRRYGIRSLDEAIDFLGMGLVTQNPLHSVEISGRGVGLSADYGDHVLVLVDGHVFNEAWASAVYFEQAIGVPIELIDRIEIMLGPGSVLYGSNAMLAVINITTKKYTSTKLVAEGSLHPATEGWGGSYRLGAGTGAEITLLGRKFDYTAHVERYAFDGPAYRFGPQSALTVDGSAKPWGGVTRNQYDTQVNSAYATLRSGDFSFMTRAESYARSTPYTNAINQPIGNFDDGRSGERDRFLSFDGRWNKQLTPKLAMNLHGNLDIYDYTQRLYMDEGALCPAPTAGPCNAKVTGVARWVGFDSQFSYDWLGDDRINTMVGAAVQGRFIGAKTDSYDTPTGSLLGTFNDRSAYELPFAFYGQQRWTPASFLHLNGGARYDDGPRGGSQLSPRAAASFDIWNGGALKGIYSQAFRAPTFYEASFEYGSPGVAPHLRPEKVRSVEGAFEQRFGRHKILFGVFRTWWTDLVQAHLDPDGRSQLQNSSINNYGYNTRVEGAFGSVRYGLSLTGARSRRETPQGEVPLTVAPQFFGNARISYELPGNLPTLALASSFMGSRLADRALDGAFVETPGVGATVRLRATLTGNVPFATGLSYRLSGEYVTGSNSPYVAGPLQFAGVGDPLAGPPVAELAPANRAMVFTGLQYDF